jgi:hypothetical protein
MSNDHLPDPDKSVEVKVHKSNRGASLVGSLVNLVVEANRFSLSMMKNRSVLVLAFVSVVIVIALAVLIIIGS